MQPPPKHLLARIHLGGEGFRRDVLLNGPFHRWHGIVGDARVVQARLEGVALGVVGHEVVKVNLHRGQS